MSHSASRRLVLKGMAATAVVGATGISVAQASAIDDIKKRGVVRIGVLSENPPWGSLDSSGKNVGYDVDVGVLLAKKLGVRAEFIGMNVAARIAQLMTGKVDLLLATMGMYPDRAKVVQFSKPYAALSIILLGKKTDKITSNEDMGGKRIAVTRAAAQDTAISAVAPKSTIIQRFDDDAASIQALLAGQVDALGANTTYLNNIRKVHPNAPYEQKLVFNRQYMGVAMKPGQKELNEWVNKFIDEIKASGELNAISQKWIGEDLPELVTELPGVPFTVQ